MPQATKVTTDTITITNDILAIPARYAVDKVSKGILTFCGLGSLVKDLIGVLKPSEPSAEMKKLIELSGKLDALSTKMEQGFNGIKTFVAAHNFYNKFGSIAATLMDFMQQTISNPSHHTKGQFQKAVIDNPPLFLAKQLINQLNEYHTNPLKLAMDEDFYPRYTTFNKWKDAINGVLAEFLILETYLNGMFWDSNMIGPNDLKSKIEEAEKKMDKWYWEYHTVNNTSWTGIEKYILNVQKTCKNIGNAAKRDKIVKDFDDMISHHAFTVLVYNDCGGYDNHAFYGHNGLFSFREGGCNIAVFRTTWEHGSCDILDTLLYDETIPHRRSNKEYIEKIYHKFNERTWPGHVGMIRENQNIAHGVSRTRNRFEPLHSRGKMVHERHAFGYDICRDRIFFFAIPE